jgi:hypothetical protein
MFDDYYNSTNRFNVHRENVNESENENYNINVRGTTMFQNKDDYYPDYEKYSQQGDGTPADWNKQAQEKLAQEKRTADAFGTVINVKDDDVVDPDSFFNNNSQVYLFYNLGEKFKG